MSSWTPTPREDQGQETVVRPATSRPENETEQDGPRPGLGLKNPARKFTAADLMRLYQRESEKQRLLVKKSDFAQAKLLFVVEALKDLLSDEGFRTLLRAERLETMPRALTARIAGEQFQ